MPCCLFALSFSRHTRCVCDVFCVRAGDVNGACCMPCRARSLATQRATSSPQTSRSWPLPCTHSSLESLGHGLQNGLVPPRHCQVRRPSPVPCDAAARCSERSKCCPRDVPPHISRRGMRDKKMQCPPSLLQYPHFLDLLRLFVCVGGGDATVGGIRLMYAWVYACVVPGKNRTRSFGLGSNLTIRPCLARGKGTNHWTLGACGYVFKCI